MTFNQLMAAVLAIFPNAEVWEDAHGEITISTGMRSVGDEDAPLADL